MITVHSSPGHIARITDAFQGIKEKHALVDAKLQLNTYVSMADDYIVVLRQESKGDMSKETCEPKSTDRSDTTLSTEISSDAIKDISKSDSSASDVTIKTETPSEGDTTVDPNLTQNDTVPDSDMTVDPNQLIGDPPKKVDSDIDGTNTTTETPIPNDDNKEETKTEVVTPDDTPHDNNKEETKTEVVTPDDTPHDNNKEETKNEVVTPDDTPYDDNNDITPVDPNEMKEEEEEGTPVIDITNDEVNGDIVTPKQPISKPTPSLGVPDTKNEESYMDVPTALEYLAKVKAYMNRPKKIKEYIDHEMKMEEFLVEQFLDKSDVTKRPEIGLFVFFFSSLAYSVYVNLCGNCKSVIDAV